MSTYDAKRAAVVAFALAAVTAAALVWSIAGCANQAGDAPALYGDWQATPAGTLVLVPAWLREEPALVAEALAEIDAAGVPADWRVEIMLPVFAGQWGGQVILERGQCDYDARALRVGWRFSACEDRPLLPALEHEIGHALHGPAAGH